MKTKVFSVMLSCLLLASCAAPAAAGSEYPAGKAFDFNGITLTKVSAHAWVFTSYGDVNGSPTPANGMLVATPKGLALVDTPWTEDQTESLLALVEKQFGKKVTLALFTHAHQDRIGGIKALQSHGIRCIGTAATAEQAERNGFAKPEAVIAEHGQEFKVGGVKLEIYFPGKAHAPDNLVVWLPEDKVLFGGCMIKSADSQSLGSLTDADTGNWPTALDNVTKKYPEAEIVVPGHGAWGGPELLEHMKDLLQ